MWKREVNGRVLRFRLAGINNQNFLMTDEETGSVWQQVSGECLLGPLKGTKLQRLFAEEVTLAIWRQEHPESTAVRFLDKYRRVYYPSNWVELAQKIPVVNSPGPGSPVGDRELVVGVVHGEASIALPLASLDPKMPVNTEAGGAPLLVLIGEDRRSVRTFLRPGPSEFFRRPDGMLLDQETGSTWDFSGKAVSGPLTGKTLERVQNQIEFWFDWKAYHPATRVYQPGSFRKGSAKPQM